MINNVPIKYVMNSMHYINYGILVKITKITNVVKN